MNAVEKFWGGQFVFESQMPGDVLTVLPLADEMTDDATGRMVFAANGPTCNFVETKNESHLGTILDMELSWPLHCKTSS